MNVRTTVFSAPGVDPVALLRELGLESFNEYHDRFFNDPSHQAAELELLRRDGAGE